MANLVLFRGRTHTVTYQHQNSDGAPIDLSGSTVYFTVKENEYDDTGSDSTALIQKTITAHSDPTLGRSVFTLTDTDTYVAPGKYYFDIVVEDAAGQSLPPSVYGSCDIKGTPTNRNV